MDLFPKWNTESLAARKCLDMGMGASVIARTLSTPCWKMTGLFRRNCSFLENLFLSALICTILTEKCCSSYLADAGDLYMFNLCQISSEHRFGYEMTSFSFLCLSATGCYTKWSLSSFLTSLLRMFECIQSLHRQHFPW